MHNLIIELKKLIIEALALEDMTPDDINTNDPLFEEGLGLDSIDALELGMSIHRKYDVKLDADSEETKSNFQSVATLASFIKSNMK